MPKRVLPEPWRSFLHELDALVGIPTELHCLGGFVIRHLYDFARVTADVDVIQVRGNDAATLAGLAGNDSALHRRHKIYLDIVTVAAVPENYEDRLIDLFPDEFTRLRLKAFESHDLALAKLERNLDRDREDIKTLAAHGRLDPVLLKRRYDTELRPYLGRPDREDLTLKLWLEMIAEVDIRLQAESSHVQVPHE